MSFSLGPALGLILAGALYVRAVRVLADRGFHVRVGQRAYWWTGWLLMVIAFFGPLDTMATKVLWAHMGQHVLLADIGAPLMLIGVRNPVLQNYLPKPILVPLARRRRLRSLFRTIRQPQYAIPIYTVVLYIWHWSPLFTAALNNDFIHALQHECFILFGLLAWWPLIEPQRRYLPAALWKIPYVIGSRIPTMFLGMAFIVMQTAVYSSYYGTGTRPGGLSPLDDQQLGGAIMMMVDVAILMVGLTVIFWRAASEADADTPIGEAAAQGQLSRVEDERDVQAGVQVAEVRQ